MPSSQKIGGYAAFLNSIIAIATLVVAFCLIGIAALTDKQKLVALALSDPLPLILQDGLKVASAMSATALVLALNERLKSGAPRSIALATAIGLMSVVCLVLNAGLSLYAVSRAKEFAISHSSEGMQLSALIGLLGTAVIVLNGIWYLVTSWQAKRSNRLPRGLVYLGVVMGGLSLVPPLGVLVLLLSIVWSVWIGRTLLAIPSAG